MKNVGVRVVSAALAACMMTSVLPVSAFAAGSGTGEGTGTGVAVPAGREELPNGGEITHGGTYEIKKDYANRVVIKTADDVIIYITKNVKYTNTEASFLDVQQVGKLRIVNEGNTVACSQNFLYVKQGATAQEIELEGGTYQCQDKAVLNFNNDGAITLDGVTALSTATTERGGVAIINNGSGTITLTGGKYTGTSEKNAVLLNNGTGRMILNTEAEAASTAVLNKTGTVTITGGSYTSTGVSATVSNSVSGGTMNIEGGTFQNLTGSGKVLINYGSLTVDEKGTETTSIEGRSATAGAVINLGTLTFNAGTITAPDGTGIMTLAESGKAADTTINGGTITGCNSGIGMQSGDITVTVNKVTFDGNTTDITLREGDTDGPTDGKQITFGDSFADDASKPIKVRVFDPQPGRQLTTNGKTVTLESRNSGYTVDYNGTYYYLKRNDVHTLTLVNATAKADDGHETPQEILSGSDVAEGTEVLLKAENAPEGQKFGSWKVTVGGTEVTGTELKAMLTATGKGEATLIMPKADTIVEALYVLDTGDDSTDPDTGDTGNGGAGGSSIGGAIAAGVVAGTVAWGIYEAGTGIYRVVNMRGIPLPTTRAELAMRIWEKADKPEPESTVLFEDIDEDDTDLQKAARWMVEQELMDEKDNNKFKPYGHVTKLRVCTTWNEAKEKGLID